MKSAIYEGTIRHRRFSPKAHDFKYKIALFYLDLDELDSIFNIPLILSQRGMSLLAWRRRDYLQADVPSLKSAVSQLVQERTGKIPAGPIRMLTQISYFGFCFNPVTFYYCFDAQDQQVEFIVAEITNTPWKERYAYVLDRGAQSGKSIYSLKKCFHVSPFLPMELDYEWRFNEPGEALGVQMENFSIGTRDKVFDSTLTLKRNPMNRRALMTTLFSFPLLTLKAVFAIYWQALRLAWKRIPFYSHPVLGEKP